MKKISILIMTICIVCIVVTEAKAQTEDVFNNRKITIGWEPLSTMDGGLRVDVEMRLKKSRNWLNLQLTCYGLSDRDFNGEADYYTNNVTFTSGFQKFRSYSGFGVQAMYKSFFFRDIFFWGGGINYHYFDVSYYDETYKPFVEDGLTFYKYFRGNESQYFNKIYPFLSTGVRSSSRKHFFVEGYIKLGYSYSFYNEEKKAYNKNFLSFGHRGVTMDLGGRIGWQF